MKTEISLSPEKSEEFFYNSICNSLSYIAAYGLKLDCSDKDYNKAKAILGGDENKLCYEDVFMQVLRNGGTLTLIDTEYKGEYTRSITLKDVHERVQQTPAQHLADAISENDDAITGDVIIQTVFFQDIIFG